MKKCYSRQSHRKPLTIFDNPDVHCHKTKPEFYFRKTKNVQKHSSGIAIHNSINEDEIFERGVPRIRNRSSASSRDDRLRVSRHSTTKKLADAMKNYREQTQKENQDILSRIRAKIAAGKTSK